MTPIEQLLAEEERATTQAAAQAAARKAKKQRQKAKRKQQEQAQQHSAEQEQQHQEQQQQHLDQPQPISQHATVHEQRSCHSHRPGDQQHLYQPQQEQLPQQELSQQFDGVDPAEAALARLAVSAQDSSAGGLSSVRQSHGAEETADQSSGLGAVSVQPQAVQDNTEFLQSLFCCPLTKVHILCSSKRIIEVTAASHAESFATCAKATAQTEVCMQISPCRPLQAKLKVETLSLAIHKCSSASACHHCCLAACTHLKQCDSRAYCSLCSCGAWILPAACFSQQVWPKL